MLPETSSMTTSRIGCGRLSNCVIGCGLSLVADLELVLRESGDEAAVAVQDRDEHPDRVAPGAEGRLLKDGRGG